MDNLTTRLNAPPWDKNADHNPRRVGVELELGGLKLDAAAKIVAALFNLTVSNTGRYERLLTGDNAGDWVIELDYAALKKLGRQELADNSVADQINRSAEQVLAWAAQPLVPVEIVSPPLPLKRLNDVEQLITLLRQHGATGTSDSAFNAFGMQLNPELASHDPEHIAACLKAFVCLYDWLFKRANINLTRKATSYVNPFPGPYVKKIINTNYWPDLATLIDDYLRDNPTRNRALDMLPLFKYLDKQRLVGKADDTLIKARPTFHYRLPDCQIDKPEWGLHVAWNDWVEVELLAADKTRLNACCQAYQQHLNTALPDIFSPWVNTLEHQWLNR